MAKQVTAQVKLQCPGGTATPAPPVGPALGAHGVNIGQFVSQFNDRTKEQRGIAGGLTVTSGRILFQSAAPAIASTGHFWMQIVQPMQRVSSITANTFCLCTPCAMAMN